MTLPAVLFAAALLASLPGCGDARPEPAASAAPDSVAADIAAPAPLPLPPRQDLPDGLVYLSDIDSTIVQDMRYTTAFNFTGAPVEGYEAPRCILAEEAARGLAGAQAELRRRGLGLKVYDCYRPQRAVDAFVAWARTTDRTAKRAFYPEVIKGRLFQDGYIASRSGHSRGATVDLTIVPLPVPPQPAFPEPDAFVPCTAPAGTRFADNSLDMGTGYDCFSPLSHTSNPAVGEAALANRYLLRDVLGRHGFRNYSNEWWHYSLRGEPFPDTYFDVPVR